MNQRSGDAELAATIRAGAVRAGWRVARIEGLKLLSGGASKESWAFDLVDEGGAAIPMVLRREPAEARFTEAGVDLATEAAIMRAARRWGAPAPEVHFELTAGSKVAGFAMARIEGETVGVRVLKDPALADAREHLARQCGEILARIHATPLADLPPLRAQTSRQALEALRRRCRDIGDDRPVFEFALRWLDDHLPGDDHVTFVHGDFRNGNMVIAPDGVRAVLDWELAHIGPPASDLAWLCVPSWRFQRPEHAVGGFGARADLLAGYVTAGGALIDDATLHAWEVYQSLNWGLMCADAGRTFAAGARSVEGAMIARRASEAEFDLLRLLLPDHGSWHAR
jgi:aminoglycoside phosphotransferase (APT) family kinase protein